MDTHALSVPALASALEVLAANGVEVMIAEGDEYTPTPAISHAILTYNRGRTTGLADGIVITPRIIRPMTAASNTIPPNGGPAEARVTGWIEAKANEFLETGLRGCEEDSLREGPARLHDPPAQLSRCLHQRSRQCDRYGRDSRREDQPGSRSARRRRCPLLGPIAERYGLNLTVVNEAVDPTFRFMTVDWDGQIRMDPPRPMRCSG